MRLLAFALVLIPYSQFSYLTGENSGGNEQSSKSVQPRQSIATTDGLSCAGFEWDDPSTKAVIRAPISIDGKLFWYQLDTGADVVIPYGSAKHEGWSRQGDAVRIPKVLFA